MLTPAHLSSSGFELKVVFIYFYFFYKPNIARWTWKWKRKWKEHGDKRNRTAWLAEELVRSRSLARLHGMKQELYGGMQITAMLASFFTFYFIFDHLIVQRIFKLVCMLMANLVNVLRYIEVTRAEEIRIYLIEEKK